MTIDDLLEHAREIFDLCPDGWTRDPLLNAVKLAEETGEVAECMVKSRKTKEDLGEELSDVIVVAAMIALQADIDLTKACTRKHKKTIKKILKKYHNGNYPSKLQRG